MVYTAYTLVLLVTPAKIWAVKTGMSIDLAWMPCWPACLICARY